MNRPIIEESKTVHRVANGDFFPSLDGVRALAILAVVIHHSFYFNLETPVGRAAYALVRPGWMGVPIFFVLSGFLISYSVFKAGANFEWSTYAARRIAKIAPPFLLSIIVFATIRSLVYGHQGMVAAALADATTIASFLPFPDLSGVYWTLYIEIYFYIILPLVYLAARRLTRFPAEATFLIFLLIPFVAKVWNHQISFDFPRGLDNFVLGIFFAILVVNHPRSSLVRLAPAMATFGALLLVLTYLIYAAVEYKFQIVNIPYAVRFEIIRYLPELATFSLLFSIFLPAKHPIVRFFTWTPLVYIGLVSYEWYLFHQLRSFPSEYLGQASGRFGVFILKTAVPAMTTLAIASGIYYCFSAPILAWVKIKYPGKAERGSSCD